MQRIATIELTAPPPDPAPQPGHFIASNNVTVDVRLLEGDSSGSGQPTVGRVRWPYTGERDIPGQRPRRAAISSASTPPDPGTTLTAPRATWGSP